MKELLGALALFSSLQQANPDFLQKENLGLSIQKPPKNDEWEFREKGQFEASLVVVGHRVDTLTVEIFVQEPATGYYDPKAEVDKQWESMSLKLKDAKKKNDHKKATKLPGNAASGVNAYWLDVSWKESDGKTVEMKNWHFVAKENRCYYSVKVVGEEKLYDKHKKFVDYIVSSLKTFRIKK